MALPHGESATLAAQLPGARIVDLSADFRLGDEAAWHQFYGDAPYSGRWAYGLPELPGAPGQPSAAEKIKAARTVAAPGCYATTSILALAPLLAAGLVEPADIVIVAASGTSGAGRSPRVDLLASEVMGSMSAYKVGGTHRHTPEIEQALSESGPGAVTLSFTPTLAPMPRGILATSTARLTPAVAASGNADGRCAPRSPPPTAAARSCTCSPRASGPSPPRSTAPTAPTCRSPPTCTRAAPSWSRPPTTSARARPGRPCRSPT